MLFIVHYRYLIYWSKSILEQHVKMLGPRKFDYLYFNKVTLLWFQITDSENNFRQYKLKGLDFIQFTSVDEIKRSKSNQNEYLHFKCIDAYIYLFEPHQIFATLCNTDKWCWNIYSRLESNTCSLCTRKSYGANSGLRGNYLFKLPSKIEFIYLRMHVIRKRFFNFFLFRPVFVANHHGDFENDWYLKPSTKLLKWELITFVMLSLKGYRINGKQCTERQ